MRQFKAMVGLAVLAAAAASSGLAAEQPTQMSDRFCETCHGVDGIGNEGVQAPRLAGMEPWYLKRQLELFRSGLRGSHPQDIEGMEMQPMAAILSDESIEDIVEWVGSWEYVAAAPTLDERGEVEADVDRGRQLYASCAACHGDQAEGSQAMNAPALQGQNDWYLLTQLRNFKAGYRGDDARDRYGSQMRIMAQSLPDEQAMIDVVSYINTLGE